MTDPDGSKPRQRRRWRPQRDWGRGLALLLCIVFALVGLVPLSLGVLVRTAPVRRWAARETTALLARELGVVARYQVEVQAWPMMIGLNQVVVEASDGGTPFLEVERIAVRPRVFSLLAGQLDVGDVEVIGPRARVVVEGGELKNLAFKRPEPSEKSEGPSRSPVSALAITDARVDARIDGVHVTAREVDVDLSAEEEGVFELSLRAGGSQVVRVHPVPGREEHEDAVDEDVICRLDARVRIEPDAFVVRRLELRGSADFDPDPGTQPSCTLAPDDWRQVELRAGGLRVTPREDGPPTIAGRVGALIPAGLVHRLVDMPHVSGAVRLDVDVDYDDKSKLPRVAGKVSADRPGLDGKVFSEKVELEIAIADDIVRATGIEAHWADGRVLISEARVEPLAEGLPLTVGEVQLEGVEFAGLLRDLGVHPRTHVGMLLREGKIDHFRGTLDPLALEGPLAASVKNFEIFDRATDDPARRHMFGTPQGNLRGTFMVKPQGVVFHNFQVDLPKSHLFATVAIGYKSTIDIEVRESTLNLSEVSPITTIPFSGVSKVKVEVHGDFDRPQLTGELAVQNFVFGGFAVGDIEQAQASFEPLVLELSDVKIKKGSSKLKSASTRIDFESADVMVDAEVDTREAPHLSIRDFFEVFHFDKDPRFEDVSGWAVGTARVHYALGGKEDRCGGGFIDVRTQMGLKEVALFGEKYDDGNLEVDFRWDDQAAGDAGMDIDIHAAQLRKGSGSILASGSISHGAKVRIGAVATGIPISRLDAFGAAGKLFDGSVSMVANLSGTLAQLEMSSDVQVSRVRIGPSAMPPSRFSLALEPGGPAPKVTGKSQCGNAVTAPFDRAEYDRDLSAGMFRANGELFGGQIALDDVRVTRQRHKMVTGKVRVDKLDLGKLANLIPSMAFSGTPPTGALSAELNIAQLPVDDPKRADVTLALRELELERGGHRVRLTEPSRTIALRENNLEVPDMKLEARTSSGLTAVLVAGGSIKAVTTAPDLDMGVRVEPLDLSRLSKDIPEVARASGTVDAQLRMAGSPRALRYSGAAHVRQGELAIKGANNLSLDAIQVDVEVAGGEVRVTRATANVGSGTLSASARMPVRGLEIGTAQATLALRNVRVPVADGVDMTADADLQATYKPGSEGGEKSLPDIKGTVALTSFSYTRPIAMSVNFGQLAGKAQRTTVESYDPKDDFVRFQVTVQSPKPLRFRNNLVDMQLLVAEPGIVLSGTNQRFGARGMLKVLPESKLTLRNSEFDVREGWVRFDDAARIAPKVDVRAQTEYRRAAGTAAASTEGASAAGAASTSGNWRINLHAHGDAEDLKVNLSSDPPLSQEDIVLLLTMGMTRAEMDSGLASSLGETVGLEALTSVTGADKAVKKVVPIIDEFRFGTGYSSRTGRTEPNVTVGKKLTKDVRANVTTGVTENREVRSTIEWRMSKRVSVQGSYDNANDTGTSNLGNIGADLRWRLEFE